MKITEKKINERIQTRNKRADRHIENEQTNENIHLTKMKRGI